MRLEEEGGREGAGKGPHEQLWAAALAPPVESGPNPEPGEEEGFPHICPGSLECKCLNVPELKEFINKLPSRFIHSWDKQ